MRHQLAFSMRWLLALVAAAAICISLVERRIRFTKIAAYHNARQERMTLGFEPFSYFGGAIMNRDATINNPRWHQAMEQKYLRAARMPWLLVPTGPAPEPYILEDCIAWRMRSLKESEAEAREACCRPPGPKPPPAPIPTDKPVDADANRALGEIVGSR